MQISRIHRRAHDVALSPSLRPPHELSKLVYLAHDLGDPAVGRRVRMLRDGGVQPHVLGFRRGAAPVVETGDGDATELGRTADARLVQRAGSVVRTALRLHRWRESFLGASVLVARNLEMLALASLARRRFAPQAALVYECLDIHTSLAGSGWQSRLMRAIEGRLLRQCDLLIVSSPAFVAAHFARRYAAIPPVTLLENKPLASELRAPSSAALPPAPPWRIGWFGVIRCRRSLQMLASLARLRPGLIEVVIRGRPARNVLPDFDRVVAETPGLSFLGGYDRSRDLADMYGGVHFTWAMDFYEAGANSTWLLPNRLYEGGGYGAVPLALDHVETGRWLAARNAGIVLAEPLAGSLEAFFDQLTPAGYAAAQAALAAAPRTDFISDAGEATRLVDALAALASDRKPTKPL